MENEGMVENEYVEAEPLPEKPPIDSVYPTLEPVYDQVDNGEASIVAEEPQEVQVVFSSPSSGAAFMAGDANNDGIADNALFEYPAHIKLDYDGTVGEPEYFTGTRFGKVFTPATSCLRTVYDTVHVVTYFILYIMLGSVLAVVWGIIFGIVEFFTVWAVQPFIKLFFTAFRCAYMVSRVWTRMFCDPCFESMALQLSKIRGNVNINMKGLHNV